MFSTYWSTACSPIFGGRKSCSAIQYMLAFMIPSINCSPPNAGRPDAAPAHDPPATILECWQYTVVFVLNWLTSHTPSEPNRFISLSHQTTEHGSGNPCPFIVCLFSKNYLQVSCASSLVKAFLWTNSRADQIDPICSILSAPPFFQPLQQCLTYSYAYVSKTIFECDAENVRSTWLADHGEACSESNLWF